MKYIKKTKNCTLCGNKFKIFMFEYADINDRKAVGDICDHCYRRELRKVKDRLIDIRSIDNPTRDVDPCGPQRRNAMWRIHRDLKSGKLIKPNFCPKCGGTQGIIAHHIYYGVVDYYFVWLCEPCHTEEHNLISRAAGNTLRDWQELEYSREVPKARFNCRHHPTESVFSVKEEFFSVEAKVGGDYHAN